MLKKYIYIYLLEQPETLWMVWCRSKSNIIVQPGSLWQTCSRLCQSTKPQQSTVFNVWHRLQTYQKALRTKLLRVHFLPCKLPCCSAASSQVIPREMHLCRKSEVRTVSTKGMEPKNYQRKRAMRTNHAVVSQVHQIEQQSSVPAL